MNAGGIRSDTGWKPVPLLLATLLIGWPALTAAPPPVFTVAGNEFHFDTGLLRGTLRAGGKSLGLKPVIWSETGQDVAGAYGLLSPYRLLTADQRFGDAAWDWPSTARLLPDGAVEVAWAADEPHPFAMTGTYRWVAADTLELRLTVTPQRVLKKFEVFLASYFAGFPESKIRARQPDGAAAFLIADQASGVWQAFPRDPAATALIGDGRWALPPHPVKWIIRRPFARPLALRADAANDLTAALMARPEECFAVMTPYGEEGHRSAYFSLFGRDLAPGETAQARARLVLRRGLTGAEAIERHESFLRDP